MPPEEEQATSTDRIEVVEERLKIGKRREERAVRLHLRPTERIERVSLPLERDEIEVERIARDEFVDAIPPVRQEGDVTIIPIVEEVVLVRMKLVEEVRVSRRRRTDTFEAEVPLRRLELVPDEVQEEVTFSPPQTP